MSDVVLLERVRALRATGSSPKEIARALGLAPAVVAPMVRAVAAEVVGPSGEPPVAEREVVGCWVSPGWSDGLTVSGHPEWHDVGSPSFGSAGLVGVLVARAARRGRVSTCGFLVDTYCLGVKNALGPKITDDGPGLRELTTFYFSSFRTEPVPAPLELAQHLVFGAADYARGLGFQPHPGFAAAAGHLGPWAPPSAITFGREGKPLYIQGPYDNAAAVMRTLGRTAG